MSAIRFLCSSPRFSYNSIIRCRYLSVLRDLGAPCAKCFQQDKGQPVVALPSNKPQFWQPKRFLGSSRCLLTNRASSNKVLVYKGSLTAPVHITKFFSLSSSLFGLCIQPYLLGQASAAHPAVIVALGSFVCFFTYVTPFLIHLITKRYVVFLHFEEETGTFTCTTLNFFLRRKLMTFKASDVVIPEIPGVFTSFLVKGTPLFVNPQDFIDIEAYRSLMGYDKPLDLQLEEDPDKKSS